jgi:hypothetical protein
MNRRNKQSLERLKKVYSKYPLVLYTGAGISYGKGGYGLPEDLNISSINEYWPTLLSLSNGQPRKTYIKKWLSRFRA